MSGTEEARVRELVSETTATPAYGISAEVRFLAERALSVLEGETVLDDARELSTADSAELPRRGSIAGYARNTLKTVWMGTDRIATGVTASPGEVLTVFVNTPEGPSPALRRVHPAHRALEQLERRIHFALARDQFRNRAEPLQGRLVDAHRAGRAGIPDRPIHG